MEHWVLLVSLVVLASQVLLGFQVPLVPKEIWEHQETREALAYKAPEEKLVSLECQESQERLVLLVRMALMVRKVGQEILGHQDHQGFQVLEVSQALMAALALQEQRDWVVNLEWLEPKETRELKERVVI